MTTEPMIDSVCPSMAVVEKIAALERTDPTELPPLYEAVDTEALDALVESATGSDATDLRVEFTYHGHQVIVTTDGVVHVEPETAEPRVA